MLPTLWYFSFPSFLLFSFFSFFSFFTFWHTHRHTHSLSGSRDFHWGYLVVLDFSTCFYDLLFATSPLSIHLHWCQSCKNCRILVHRSCNLCSLGRCCVGEPSRGSRLRLSLLPCPSLLQHQLLVMTSSVWYMYDTDCWISSATAVLLPCYISLMFTFLFFAWRGHRCMLSFVCYRCGIGVLSMCYRCVVGV